MPKGMQHFAWFTEETIIQVHGMGPQGITYVNPADDPQKEQLVRTTQDPRRRGSCYTIRVTDVRKLP